MGMRGDQQYSLKSAILLSSHLLFALLLTAAPSAALNIGVKPTNPDLSVTKQQQCSRKCESDHCTVPPFLRYGKYCGILYSGCPGERPCDALDACCQTHDACVEAHHNDYLSTSCNENLLNCIAAVRVSDAPTFRENKCMVQEVADVITVVIEAALLAGRFLHKP